MTEEVMKIWDALSPSEQDELRKKVAVRNLQVDKDGRIHDVVYMHSSKEEMYDVGAEMGLNEEALNTFCRTGYELELSIAVDPVTGKAVLLQVSGVSLAKEVAI